MAYDEELADRIRELVAGEPDLAEQRMFGGLAFLVNGNMSVAASGKGGLLARVDPDDAAALLSEQVDYMTMGGREMTGWLRVDPAAIDSDDELAAWVERGVRYARSLPAKRKK
ncbi:Transcriptional regulator of competence genes, TfoX/Sxy family [Amycolatopsis xylanica]|uniref:Transcriptional regulator of competence genes, TfoX/Sxy family n=1 Tax=Amycolatopsis xylanica TaxID=589385 RepID=A0A1H3H5L0_9PSEU|nr:TfoX/Sxy family protein [Amycolatopsis xylanica]SDY10505.1 Transcriptional regulator of competence genes, TfoX/Sxy family [Amycolatopsis xylanica]